MKTLEYALIQIGHLLDDVLTPVLIRLFTRKTFSSSRFQIENLLKQLHPVVSPKKLIRLGPSGDGGYLVPDDLGGITACFSPGVSDEAGFELSIAQMGIPCYLADASVTEEPVKHEQIFFEPLFLGPTSDGDRFISLQDWVVSKDVADGDLLLQMDIEGAEYEVLSSAPKELLGRFRVIAIELHHLEHILTNKFSALGFGAFLEKLKEQFEVVHIHPNNNRRPVVHEAIEIPPVIEVTFLRKDRFQKTPSSQGVTLPNPLDADNSKRRKSLTFSSEWAGSGVETN